MHLVRKVAKGTHCMNSLYTFYVLVPGYQKSGEIPLQLWGMFIPQGASGGGGRITGAFNIVATYMFICTCVLKDWECMKFINRNNYDNCLNSDEIN